MRCVVPVVLIALLAVTYSVAQQPVVEAGSDADNLPGQVKPMPDLPPDVPAQPSTILQPYQPSTPGTVPNLVTVPPPSVAPRPLVPKFDKKAAPGLQLVWPVPGSYLNEGGAKLIWNTQGPIASVRVFYNGDLCPVGGVPRGTFGGPVIKVVNTGTYVWSVPWMDAAHVRVTLVGYGLDNAELASTEVIYQFRPKILQDKPDTCIVVSKSRQRLWYLVDGFIKRMHVVSTADGGYVTPTMRPGSRDPQRGEMGKVFSKAFAPVSRQYNVVMYYWLQITQSGSHGIHATSPALYSALGGPASHGCVRQHRLDAKVLWEMVPVGTKVYVE